MSAPMTGPDQHRRLVRSSDRMVAGVCGGTAQYLGVDPTVVRVLTAVAGVVFFPVVPLLYVVMWAVVPRQ